MSLGLADPILHDHESLDNSLLPKSIIYNTSCTRFFKPVLTPADDDEEIITRRNVRVKGAFECIMRCQSYYGSNLNNQVAHWDTQFETGAKTALLQPFSPIVVAADDTGCIRVWNYEETTLLNSFNNHEHPNKGIISKLLLLNELDDSLLLVASSDGNVRVWKDYTTTSKQKPVTAFSSIQDGKGVNAVVDWQQQSGYFYASGGISSTMIWDMNKEQIISSIPLASDCSISALAASQVHGDLYVAGFTDGSVRLFDIRTPEGPVCVARPHTPRVERVVGIGFQPGLYPAKIVSASEAGDIKFLDMRKQSGPNMAIDAHRGSLTTLAIHRHAPLVASGSADSQLIKVFNTEGERLTTVRQSPNFMARKVGPTSCLAFHPYQVLLAAGSTDGSVSIYADEASGLSSKPEFHSLVLK